MLGPWRQDLEDLQELDQGILLVFGQGLERPPLGQRFAVVGQHRLAQRGEQPVVKVGRFVGGAPEPLGEKTRLPPLNFGDQTKKFWSRASDNVLRT